MGGRTRTLTPDLTSSNAELIRETETGGVSEGVFPVPRRLTVMRSKSTMALPAAAILMSNVGGLDNV